MGTPETICLATGAVAALLIAWMDLARRTVRLVPLLLLLGSGLAYLFLRGTADPWTGLGINALLVTGILCMTWLGVRLAGISGFINRNIGWGDVVLFYAMTAWFSPAGFALYFSGGLLFSLAGVLLAMSLGRYPRDLPLPLAGCMALFALVFMPFYLRFEAEILAAFEAGW